ncbi:MAG: TonB-dependent receptor [Bacteroidia bacterium]|nr:TonB-dependent receptor [Bacteroidia bacterium]
MKKNICLFLVLANYFINGQVTLTGTIKSKKNNEALPGAVIYFPDLKNGAVSSENGSYQINNLPSIKTLAQVKLFGYKTIIQSIDLSSLQVVDFVMEESIIEADEVVVTGVSKATEIKRSPAPMTLIDSKHLEQNTATNIVEVLNKTPGLNVVSSGPNVSKPVIRGLAFNRVLTLFDGIRQEGQQWGEEHGVEIDQYLIDRVEVIKGPASLIYGSDALAGVLNFLPYNPVTDGKIKANLETNYQTNNGLRAASFSLDGNQKGIIFGLRGTYKEASNFRNKYDGRVYNTGFNEKNIYGYVGANRKWGYSHLSFSMFDNEQEIPDGSRDSASRKFTKQITEEDTMRPVVSEEELKSYTIDPVHQRVQHYRIFSSNTIILRKSKLAARVGYQSSIRREYGHPDKPEIPALYLQMGTATYDFKYYLAEKRGWESVIGVNGMWQNNKVDRGTEFVVPDYSLIDVGPFVYVKKSLSKWDMAFGARYDSRSFQNKSLYVIMDPETGFDKVVSDTIGATKLFEKYSHNFSGASGSFGATYNVNERLLFKANIARGYRAPNISEISAEGVHPGTGYMQLGDANLKPEFNLQEDLAVFFESEHLSFNVELFNNIITNYIFNEKLSSAMGEDSLYMQGGNDYPVFKFRQTKAWLYGGEISIDIHPHPLDWLHFENSLSLVNAENLGGQGAVITENNRYLPFIPPLHTHSELRAEFRKKVGLFTNVYVKLAYQYYAAQNRAYLEDDTETKTPSYALLDLGVGATAKNKKNKELFSFGVFVTNLSDVAYQSNMSRLKYFDNYPNNYTGRSGIYSMGRNLSVKIKIPINIKG